MLKKHVNIIELIKSSIIPILVFFCGVVLTVTSFCVYFLIEPPITAVLVVICVIDCIYTFFCACLSCKYITTKWLLSGILWAIGYLVVFITIPTLYMVFIGEFETLKNSILNIAYFAFYIGPCIMFVAPLIIVMIIEGA